MAQPTETQQKKPEILLVADDPLELSNLESLLHALQTNIFKAKSLNDIFQSLEHQNCAAIIIQSKLADIPSTEIASLIRSEKDYEAIPILFIEDKLSDDYFNFDGHDKGLIDYIQIPFNEHLLRNKIQNYLERFQFHHSANYYRRQYEELLLKQQYQNQQFDEIAHQDTLTQIPNKTAFESMIKRNISYAKRHDTIFALIMVGLDHFRMINDEYGYEVGNKILQEVAKRLKGTLREEDFIARLSGDEFIIILSGVQKSTDAAIVAGKLIHILNYVYQFEERFINMTASLGVVIYPDGGDNPNVLIKNADIALFRAKATGRNKYVYYSQDTKQQYQNQISIENALHMALKNNQMQVLYAPKYNMKTRELIGLQALLRWDHPDFGLLLPENFISTAHHLMLTKPIAEWYIKKACEEFRVWLTKIKKNITLTINLLPDELFYLDLIPFINKIIEAYNLPPACIELELSEQSIMKYLTNPSKELHKLFQEGIKFSVDDFNISYFSLSRIKEFPIHGIKIKSSFIDNIEKEEAEPIVLKSILNLAKNLNLNIVAEGVETERQLKFLQDNACQHGQGPLFSPPLSKDKIDELFK